MVFSSILFIFYFMPLMFTTYWLVPFKFKNILCLAFSLFFYAWGEPVYIFLMLASILVNYLFGVFIGKSKDRTGKKKIVVASVIYNMTMLGVFKYTGFVLGSFAHFTGIDLNIPVINLPLGISFFTFQAMSYVLDVYRGNAPAQRSVWKVALYISAFPQLVAGPIVRYNSIMEQIDTREISLYKVEKGIVRFCVGLGKKVLIANYVGEYADQIFRANIGDLTVLTAWIGLVCYTLQIYYDFSGYSDMAIGLGRMLGFEFEENFNYPYISKSITEFWRRWHISLGKWFRDYLYFPLGGSKVSRVLLVRNLFIVWLATGIWHGAGWTFVLWGLYYFVILVIEKYSQKLIKMTPNIIKHIVTIFLVMLGWVVFRSESLHLAIQYYGALFGALPFSSNYTWEILKGSWIPITMGIIGSTPIVVSLYNVLVKKVFVEDGLVVSLLRCGYMLVILGLSTMFLVNSTYNPFIYFRF